MSNWENHITRRPQGKSGAEDIVQEETENKVLEDEELEQKPESEIDKFYLVQFQMETLVHHYVKKFFLLMAPETKMFKYSS